MLIHQDSSPQLPHPWICGPAPPLFEAPPEYPAGWISAGFARGKSSRPWCGVRAPRGGWKVGKGWMESIPRYVVHVTHG